MRSLKTWIILPGRMKNSRRLPSNQSTSQHAKVVILSPIRIYYLGCHEDGVFKTIILTWCIICYSSFTLNMVNLNFLHIEKKSHVYFHIAGISRFYSKESSLLVVTVDMGKSGDINRKEPEGIDIMET
jgi:hypothetical protein